MTTASLIVAYTIIFFRIDIAIPGVLKETFFNKLLDSFFCDLFDNNSSLSKFILPVGIGFL